MLWDCQPVIFISSAIIAPSGRLSSAVIREDFGIGSPPARLLRFLPDVVGFAVVATFLGEIFDIVVLLSSATGSFRRWHHPKPAKSRGQHRHQFTAAEEALGI